MRGVYELRCLGYTLDKDGRWKKIVSGYYDDLGQMAADAKRYDGFCKGVYLTLNPVNPDLLARAWNKPREDVKDDDTTKDQHVVRRIWLPLDFDPVRVAGISSSDEELAAALAQSDACRAWLAQEDFGEPLRLPGVAAGIWVEIKGGPPEGRARRLVAELAAAGQTVALQYGTVGRPDRSGGSDSAEVYLPDGGRTARYAWCCCPGCGRAGLEHGGDGPAVCEGGCRAGGPHDVWRSDWKVEDAYPKARRHSFWSGGLRPLGLGWEG